MIILKIFLGIIMVAMIPVVKGLNYDQILTLNKKKRVALIISEVITIILFVLSCSLVTIPTGNTGVRVTFGQVNSTAVSSGIHAKKPFVESVIKINNKQQDMMIEDKIWGETKTRTAIYFKGIVVTYQILPEKSAWVYANVTDYKQGLISDELVSSAVKSASKNFSDEDATNRTKIEPMIAKCLQNSIDAKYEKGVVKINKVVANNIDFEKSYNTAIANKQKAKLEAEKQAIDNQKSIDKAKAEAESKKIIAKGEAEANAIIQKSLTDKVLKEKYIERWNGQLPKVVTGDDASVLLQP